MRGAGRSPASADREDEVLPGAERSELRERAITGVRWAAASRGVTEVVALLASFILARLISPTEFGFAAAAVIFPTLAEVLLYEGFGTNLVRRKEATRREAGVALALSLAFGLTCFAVVFVGALLAQPAVGATRTHLFQFAAVAFLLSAPNVVPQAVLQRQLAFKVIAARDATALLIGTAAAIVAAAVGAGAFAIIGGLLVRRLVTTVLLILVTEGVPLRWDRAVARRVVGFGALTSLAGILTLTKKNVDYFLLSFLIPSRQLGFYYRAYSLGVDYQSKVSLFANRIMLPMYARAADPDDMWRLRRRFAQLQIALVMPVLAVFVVTAPLTIPVLFGSRWEPSVLPAQILVAVPMSALLGNGTGPLLVAAGRPGAVAATNGLSLVLYASMILVVAGQGLVTICIFVGLFNLAFGLATSYVLVNRVLGFSMVEVLREFVAPLIAIAPTVALVLVTDDIEATFPSALLVVPAVVLFCALTYGAILRLAFPGTARAAEEMVRQVVKRPRRTAVA